MQELVKAACGFDILNHLNLKSLQEACQSFENIRLDVSSWDELFSELQVTFIDPYLATLGAVFVTHWPRPLAVLAKGDPKDPRVALRFELYLGGLELANGFEELTDPKEQQQRFEEDIRQRRQRRLPDMPMPKRFINALSMGMPPSAGVAVGVDRLLMLATDCEDIQAINPFGVTRCAQTANIEWGSLK